jgi:hypothetical protein
VIELSRVLKLNLHISAGFERTFLTANLTVKILWAFCFRILPSEAIPGGAKAYK